MGSISGERSFAANSRERGRTRANPRELRPRSPTVRQLFYFANSANVRPRSPNVRRTFGELLANSPEFARIRAESAANWRTVRQKILRLQAVSHIRRTIVRRERSFAANPRSPAKLFAVSSPRTVFSRTLVRPPHGESQIPPSDCYGFVGRSRACDRRATFDG